LGVGSPSNDILMSLAPPGAHRQATSESSLFTGNRRASMGANAITTSLQRLKEDYKTKGAEKVGIQLSIGSCYAQLVSRPVLMLSNPGSISASPVYLENDYHLRSFISDLVVSSNFPAARHGGGGGGAGGGPGGGERLYRPHHLLAAEVLRGVLPPSDEIPNAPFISLTMILMLFFIRSWASCSTPASRPISRLWRRPIPSRPSPRSR
jgi:hypothetical protein